MRSFESAASSWQEIKQCPSLPSLREIVRLDGRTPVATAGLRSACWKAFLLFDSVDTDEWPLVLLSSRSAYNSLRLHFLRYLEDQEDGEADHLNEEVEVSKTTSRGLLAPYLTLAET